MLNFNFDANSYEEKEFTILPVGDYRVRVKSAEECTSKSGKQMVKLVLAVSGKANLLFHYLVVTEDSKQTSQRFGEFWDCFGIPMGTMDVAKYVGTVGAVRVKHEEYNGEQSAKVHYLINKKKQATLPAWVEPVHNKDNSESAAPQNYYGTPPAPTNNAPFDPTALL